MVQLSPTILAKVLASPYRFEKLSEFQWSLEHPNLEFGTYYISVGRPRGGCDLFIDKTLHASTKGPINDVRASLTLGTPLIVTPAHPSPESVRISCDPVWKPHGLLPRQPEIFSYFRGVLVQTLRSFTDVILGPISGLLLIILALASFKTDSRHSVRKKIHLFFGVSAFLYSVSLAHISRFFLNGKDATFVHIIIRNIFSLSMTMLFGAYSRQRTLLIGALIVSMILICILGFLSEPLIEPIYRLQYILFLAAAFIMTYTLYREHKDDVEPFEIGTLRIVATTYALTLILDTLNIASDGALVGPYISPSFLAIFTYMTARMEHRRQTKMAIQNSYLQSELKHAQNLSTLATQLSHDIRSPVMALSAVATYAKGISGEEKKLLHSSAERIKQIADDLLKKHKTNRPLQTELLVLLENIVNECRALVPEKKIEIKLISQSHDRSLIIAADPAQLSRVLSNLMNNAVESIDSTGFVQVEVQQSGEAFVCVLIKDNGKGIPKDILPKLMNKGFTHEKTHGTGLGLYSAKLYIESIGGKVEIESQIKIGTDVYVTLPVAAK